MRYFDVATAQRFVPTLAKTFTEVRSCAQHAQELTQLLAELAPGGDPIATSRFDKLEMERDRLVAKIRREIEKLEELGIEVKSVGGLVDFRALRSGRPVYLCWQYGEEVIGYWHELDGGFSGRRPIGNVSAFLPSYLS